MVMILFYLYTPYSFMVCLGWRGKRERRGELRGRFMECTDF
jgi:hypothetical protein